MIKARSKSKIKHTVTSMKKTPQLKKCKAKNDEKQNGITSLRLTQALCQSKKGNKANTQMESSRKAKNKSHSQFCFAKKNNNAHKKHDDEQFIEKLFSQTQQIKEKPGCFIENLIDQLIPAGSEKKIQQIQRNSFEKIVGLQAQLEQKRRHTRNLLQEIEQLKLYVSNFTFKVFDLTVICKNLIGKILADKQKIALNKKITQVVSYIESLVRQWNLEEKIKIHTESTFRKPIKQLNTSQFCIVKTNQMKKRCHTESLKIPLQEYLESLQSRERDLNQEVQNIGRLSLAGKKQSSDNKKTTSLQRCLQKSCQAFQDFENAPDEEVSEQMMRIVSRRNSEVRKEDDQIYVVLKTYNPANGHELKLRAGDRVTVLDKKNDKKWVGFKDGAVGYFPKDILF